MQRPDVPAELSRLKDFQRATVDYAFRRLYLDEDATSRFLVADEVGLGKTLVAKGLIAKTIDHLWDTVDRIDIVYVCSNINIARQNRNRLSLHSQQDAAIESRITLLPLRTGTLNDRKVNLILLTPGTSLDLGRSAGTVQERALLFLLLEHMYGLDRTAYSYVFCANASRQRFLDEVAGLEEKETIDYSVCERLATLVTSKLHADLSEFQQEFGRKTKPSRDLAQRRNTLIGKFRHLLATACVEMLEPDLIILDEFQRFKPLLQGEGEAGELARQLFEYVGHGEDVRLVLLSATPYRMYGSSDDGTEVHYEDFLATMDFLLQAPERSTELRQLLQDFRQALLAAPIEGLEPLIPLSARLRLLLRSVMARTERVGAGQDASGMLREVVSTEVRLHPEEIKSYRGLSAVAQLLTAADPIEYWKSAPQALSYMETYQLRKKLTAWIHDQDDETLGVLEQHPTMMLDTRRAGRVWSLESRNGKTDWLRKHTVEAGMWQCLWLPPALPYYDLGGPFAALPAHARTKQLVFSAWQLVPRSLAATLSHEAEIRGLSSLEQVRVGQTLKSVRNRTGNLLELAVEAGRPQRMTNAGLLYPSVELAKLGDPALSGPGLGGTQEDLLSQISANLIQRIKTLGLDTPSSGRIDADWYWAAPVLLDRQADPELTVAGSEECLYGPLSRDEEEERIRGAAGRQAHFERFLEVARNGWTPTGPPPDDLVKVLALSALGNPAVVAVRALARVVGWKVAESSLGRASAERIADAFRRLYNLADATGIVESATDKSRPYWLRCIGYGAMGGLSAVLDEFAHVAVEDEGLQSADPEEKLVGVTERICDGIALRRASVTAHQWKVNREGMATEHSQQMNTRFAVRFGEEKNSNGEGDHYRADDVRKAFNSPFWPFVLITTSVGQEGLDFHWYAHSVIHWNLPNNPVDLEQREGRVHRYKGHAIRRNVATRWGRQALADGAEDPWAAAFELACTDRSAEDCDLVPFWVYPCDGGVSVERHVPAYPLSKDALRLERLRKALVLYRMVFGQARQEELLGFLQQRVPEAELLDLAARLRIDLTPSMPGV
jgi:hypothetical protein